MEIFNSQQEVDACIARLEEMSLAYYQEARPLDTDAAYDQLIQKLKRTEQQRPEWVRAGSPTNRVMQGRLPGFVGVKHLSPMLSLDNVFDLAGVANWVRRVKAQTQHENPAVVIQPKVDGLSMELRYEHGFLVTATTRGNGQVGDDVTAQARLIKGVPLQILAPAAPLLRVRGEVYITKADFAAVNEAREQDELPLLANPRNAAAGAMHSLDLTEAYARRLSFLAYEVYGLPYVKSLHFASPLFRLFTEQESWTLPGELTAENLHQSLLDMACRRLDLPFLTDGAVVKLVDPSLRELMGESASAPYWAFAYKYPPEEAETTLKAVTWQVGKFGTLTPVAELDPVTVAGSVISRATLHNMDQIRTKDLRIGDRVLVSKAGEVVPQVAKALVEKRKGTEVEINVPPHCPACSDPTGGVAVCTNANCTGVVRARLLHFGSKGALDVQGMGGALVDRVVSRGVATPEALLALSVSELGNMGLSPKQAAKLRKTMDAVIAESSQERLLYGLCIEHVGRTASKALMQHFGGIDAVMAAADEQITGCPDLLPVAAAGFLTWRAKPQSRAQLECFRKLGFKLQASVAQEMAGTQLAGQTWCITGTLSVERDVAAALVRSHGGKVSSGVTSKTNFVLVGDKPGANKIAAAAKHNVPQVDETEFRKRIGALS
jgi:DNA ligase (NAD+)